MLVFVLLPEAERTELRQHHYSHIECDVAGCGARSPPTAELLHGKSLVERGWFIEGGRHRCPDHYDRDDASGSGPAYRDA